MGDALTYCPDHPAGFRDPECLTCERDRYRDLAASLDREVAELTETFGRAGMALDGMGVPNLPDPEVREPLDYLTARIRWLARQHPAVVVQSASVKPEALDLARKVVVNPNGSGSVAIELAKALISLAGQR